jgi:uncharacterized peroxidase-related enzyme
MNRFQPIDPQTATGKARTLLDAVKAKLGLVPNLTRVMANAPSVLEGYLGLSGALGGGTLPAKLREQLALVVGQRNGCDYCLAAHTALGRMAGLTPDQVQDARRGWAVDGKTRALLHFAERLVEARGRVQDEELAAARAAGWSDAELLEVVGHVALNIFTNYVNHVAETPIDFPIAPPLATAAAGR